MRQITGEQIMAAARLPCRLAEADWVGWLTWWSTKLLARLIRHLCAVVLEEVLFVLDLGCPERCGVAVERRFVVGLSKQRLNRPQHRAGVVDGRPLLLEDVQADVAVLVDVGVVARGLELDSRGNARVVVRECDGEIVLEPIVYLSEASDWGHERMVSDNPIR